MTLDKKSYVMTILIEFYVQVLFRHHHLFLCMFLLLCILQRRLGCPCPKSSKHVILFILILSDAYMKRFQAYYKYDITTVQWILEMLMLFGITYNDS